MSHPCLEVKRGQRIGHRFSFGDRLVIGRDIDCDLQLFDEGLSRTHFVIERAENGYRIKDLGSSNGTYVNGQRVSDAPLSGGDLIRAGAAELSFYPDGSQPVETGPAYVPSFELDDTVVTGSETQIKKRVDISTVRWMTVRSTVRADTPDQGGIEEEQASKALSVLYKVSNLANSAQDLSELYNKIIEIILEIVPGDRAFLLLWNDELGRIEPVASCYGKRQSAVGASPTVSRTVVEECVKTGVSILSSDAMLDNRFKAGQSVMLQNIRSVLCVPVESNRQVLGAIYLDTLAASGLFLEFDLELVSAIGKQAGVAIERTQLMDNLSNLFYQTIRTLVATIEAKDRYTRGHSERVTSYAVQIAQEMDLDPEVIDLVHLGGLLHDIGKVGVPESVLNKSGELTSAEFDIIKTHPEIGADIVRNIKGTERVLDLVLHHHERFGGGGYPAGLKGEEISLPTRILTVADCYDAMTSNRSYRQNLNKAEIVSEYELCSGDQFDPEVAQVFLKLLREDRLVDIDTVYQRGLDQHFGEYFEKLKHRVSGSRVLSRQSDNTPASE